MQLVSAPSSSSSTSSSSQSSGDQLHCNGRSDMQKLERMHLHSLSPPPPLPFKRKKHRAHHRHHSPPPLHHHHHASLGKHRHHSPLPRGSRHFEKGLLRAKKVRKLHHSKVMKTCRDGSAHYHHMHVPPAPQYQGAAFSGVDAMLEHLTGCCNYYHGRGIHNVRPAEEHRPPHMKEGADGPPLCRMAGHSHRHKRHPPAHPQQFIAAPPPLPTLLAD